MQADLVRANHERSFLQVHHTQCSSSILEHFFFTCKQNKGLMLPMSAYILQPFCEQSLSLCGRQAGHACTTCCRECCKWRAGPAQTEQAPSRRGKGSAILGRFGDRPPISPPQDFSARYVSVRLSKHHAASKIVTVSLLLDNPFRSKRMLYSLALSSRIYPDGYV